MKWIFVYKNKSQTVVTPNKPLFILFHLSRFTAVVTIEGEDADSNLPLPRHQLDHWAGIPPGDRQAGNPDGGQSWQSGNPGRAMPQLWQGSGGGQSSEDQIEAPVDDDGASLSIVGARGPINSHWVTPICTNSHAGYFQVFHSVSNILTISPHCTIYIFFWKIYTADVASIATNIRFAFLSTFRFLFAVDINRWYVKYWYFHQLFD